MGSNPASTTIYAREAHSEFEQPLDKGKEVGANPTSGTISECSTAWLVRLLWEQKVMGSNPLTPTILSFTGVTAAFTVWGGKDSVQF